MEKLSREKSDSKRLLHYLRQIEQSLTNGFSTDTSRQIDNLLLEAASFPNIPSSLSVQGELIELLASQDFFPTQTIRKVVLASLEKASHVTEFDRTDRTIAPWMSSMREVVSFLSLSPRVVGFFERHKELLSHKDFSIRHSCLSIKSTNYWTFNKFDKCFKVWSEVNSGLSQEEAKEHAVEMEALFLVTTYMNGELEKTLDLADKIYDRMRPEERGTLRWLEVIVGTVHSFLGHNKLAKEALDRALLSAGEDPKETVAVNIAILSHLLFSEQINEAAKLAEETEELLKRTYEDFVYPHIVVTLYRLIAAFRKKEPQNTLDALMSRMHQQAKELPADAFYEDIALAYLAKFNGKKVDGHVHRLKKIMGPRVPATLRLEKGLSDQW